MSQENVELVRSIYAAWERGDYSSAEWAHPEIEYVSADGPAPGRSTGLAGMAGVFSEWLSAWEEWRVEAEEYRHLGGGRVLVLSTSTAPKLSKPWGCRNTRCRGDSEPVFARSPDRRLHGHQAVGSGARRGKSVGQGRTRGRTADRAKTTPPRR